MNKHNVSTLTIRWRLFFWFGGIVAIILLISSYLIYQQMSDNLKYGAQRELECITDNLYHTTEIAFDNAIKAYLLARAEKTRDLCLAYQGMVLNGELGETDARERLLNVLSREEYTSNGTTGFLSLIQGKGEVLIGHQAMTPGVIRLITKQKNGYLSFTTDSGQASGHYVSWLLHFKPWDYVICAFATRDQLTFLFEADHFEPYLSSIKMGKEGYPFLLSTKGEMLVHPELAGKILYHQKDYHGKAFVQDMIQRKNGLTDYYWKKPNSEEIGRKIVSFRTNEDLGWLIASGIYEDELFAPLYKQRKLFGLYILISLMIILVTAFFFSKSFTRPIRQMVSILERAKNGDLTQRLEIFKKDEIGRIMEIINEFMDALFRITGDIHQKAEELNSSTSDLASISQEIYSTANQQAAAVAEVVATVEEFATMSRQMAKNASGVAQVALETEQDVERGAGNVNATLDRMKTIKTSNEDNIQEMNKLGKRIEQINEILKFINNIADQTKLIAFNAALESSSSEGSSGKRFGIVAIEIRRLAEGIVEQTRDIEDTINEITQATNELRLSFEQSLTRVTEGYNQAEETAKVLETILGGSKQTRKASRQIDSGTAQQQVALDQIVATLKEISETVQHFVGATKQSDEITRNINEITEQFRKSVSQFKLHKVE